MECIDNVLLHVFDHQLENELAEKSQMIIDKSKVKVEDPTMMENTYSSFPMIAPDKVQVHNNSCKEIDIHRSASFFFITIIIPFITLCQLINIIGIHANVYTP